MPENLYYFIPDKGYIRVRKFNGAIVPHYLLEHPLSSAFSGYRLISKDLETVQEALSVLLNTNYV